MPTPCLPESDLQRRLGALELEVRGLRAVVDEVRHSARRDAGEAVVKSLAPYAGVPENSEGEAEAEPGTPRTPRTAWRPASKDDFAPLGGLFALGEGISGLAACRDLDEASEVVMTALSELERLTKVACCSLEAVVGSGSPAMSQVAATVESSHLSAHRRSAVAECGFSAGDRSLSAPRIRRPSLLADVPPSGASAQVPVAVARWAAPAMSPWPSYDRCSGLGGDAEGHRGQLQASATALPSTRRGLYLSSPGP